MNQERLHNKKDQSQAIKSHLLVIPCFAKPSPIWWALRGTWEKDTESKCEENLDTMMKRAWNLHGLLSGLFTQLTTTAESDSKMNFPPIKSSHEEDSSRALISYLATKLHLNL